MGSYAGVISADVLTAECRRNVKPELAELKGKRFLLASELEEGRRMSTSLVKQLSSTDEIERGTPGTPLSRHGPSALCNATLIHSIITV